MGRISLSSDDEDFPSLQDLLSQPIINRAGAASGSTKLPSTPPLPKNIPKVARALALTTPSTIRCRKLGQRQNEDNPLFRKLGGDSSHKCIGAVGSPSSCESWRQPPPTSSWALRPRLQGTELRHCRSSTEGESNESDVETSEFVTSLDIGDEAEQSGSDSQPLRRAVAVSVGGMVAAGPATPTWPKQASGGLLSPKKTAGIPQTPHRPSLDIFWSQEFVNDWNDEHSPVKKLVLPSPKKSPIEKRLHSKEIRAKSPTKPTYGRHAKKTFESQKHKVAEAFLGELDTVITEGKLGELAKSTGGIKLNWTNKLNTTAGRANWKRETVRTNKPFGVDIRHKHHASIDLAEKVIDDEDRLLNVIAHEFCHLANFMVSGVTGNPHGKEFKAWAAKCTRSFGGRGIEVTTKHTYDIDFKYVWQCTACSAEFKRHSKSINPERHRCGSCKSLLQQIKPKPRAQGKPSEYQQFVREQMKLVKEENPRSPQKDVMRIIAGRWAKQTRRKVDPASKSSDGPIVEEIVNQLDQLALGI